MKTYLKLYAEFCVVLLLAVWVLGLVAPSLVSSDSMVSVFIGFALLLGVPPAVGIYGWHVHKKLKELKGRTDEENTAAARLRR